VDKKESYSVRQKGLFGPIDSKSKRHEEGRVSAQNINPQKKAPAVSHMLFFFVIPAVVFVGWAAYKLVDSSLHPIKQDFYTRLDSLKKASRSGDKWQASYSIAFEVQRMMKTGELAKLSPEERVHFYSRTGELLLSEALEPKMKHYLLVNFGQTGAQELLGPTKALVLKSAADPELEFFAAWSFLELLSKNPSEKAGALSFVQSWAQSKNLGLKKIAASYLVQQGDSLSTKIVEDMLGDAEEEIQWNAAAALASVGNAKGEAILSKIFNLERLRALQISNSQDLKNLLASAWFGAKKLNSPELLAKVETLKKAVNPASPEGRAILAALAQ
jgi:hypothetical protein